MEKERERESEKEMMQNGGRDPQALIGFLKVSHTKLLLSGLTGSVSIHVDSHRPVCTTAAPPPLTGFGCIPGLDLDLVYTWSWIRFIPGLDMDLG